MAGQPHQLEHWRRLRERFLKNPDSLPDYELLELLLTLGKGRGGDMKRLAKELIDEFGSLGEVLHADPDRLQEINGIGEVTAAALVSVRTAAVRLAQGKILNRSVVTSWEGLLEYCQGSMSHKSKEQFRILFLDRRNAVIADEMQQEGTVDHTPVYPREVVQRALKLGASAIIMVHNHPSGDPTPSAADVEMTRRVADAADKMGISVHDHLVIGGGTHASFRALGLLK